MLGTVYGAGNRLTLGGVTPVGSGVVGSGVVGSGVVGLTVVGVGVGATGVGAVVVVGLTVVVVATGVGAVVVVGLTVVVVVATGVGAVVVVGLTVVVVATGVGAVVVVGSTGVDSIVVVGETETWSTIEPEGSADPAGSVTLSDTGNGVVVGDGSGTVSTRGATSTRTGSTLSEPTRSESTRAGSGGSWTAGAHADAANTRTSPAATPAATWRGIRKQPKTDITTTPYRNTATDTETPSQTIVDVNFGQSRTPVRGLHATIAAHPKITARGGGGQNSGAAICDISEPATPPAARNQRCRRLL